MQISTIPTTNPNQSLGLWVEHVYYPTAGAGQIQSFGFDRKSCFMEHWQKPVVSNYSLNGLLYSFHNLQLAEHLYMGHHGNTLYYVHKREVRKMEFMPNYEIPSVADFDEVTHFSKQKAYLIWYHRQSTLLTNDDEEMVINYWQYTQELEGLIPYLIPYQGIEPISITEHLESLKQAFVMA